MIPALIAAALCIALIASACIAQLAARIRQRRATAFRLGQIENDAQHRRLAAWAEQVGDPAAGVVFHASESTQKWSRNNV